MMGNGDALIGIILLVVGVGLVALGGRELWRRHRFRRYGVDAIGEVVAAEGRPGRGFNAIVEYPLSDRRVRFRAPWFGLPRIGDRVMLRYDQARPERAVLRDYLLWWKAPWPMTIVAVGLGAIAVSLGKL